MSSPNLTPEEEPAGPSRRALVAGAAWTVPAVVLISAAPEAAASPTAKIAITVPVAGKVFNGVSTSGAYAGSVTVSGTVTPGNTVKVTVTDGTTTIGPFETTVTAGKWTTINPVNLLTLKEGVITFNASTSDPIPATPVQARKDVTPPVVKYTLNTRTSNFSGKISGTLTEEVTGLTVDVTTPSNVTVSNVLHDATSWSAVYTHASSLNNVNMVATVTPGTDLAGNPGAAITASWKHPNN